jgi:hypothetical protein
MAKYLIFFLAGVCSVILVLQTVPKHSEIARYIKFFRRNRVPRLFIRRVLASGVPDSAPLSEVLIFLKKVKKANLRAKIALSAGKVHLLFLHLCSNAVLINFEINLGICRPHIAELHTSSRNTTRGSEIGQWWNQTNGVTWDHPQHGIIQYFFVSISCSISPSECTAAYRRRGGICVSIDRSAARLPYATSSL